MVDEQDRRTGTFLVTYRPDVADSADTAARACSAHVRYGPRTAARIDQRYQVRMIENGRELQIEALSIDGERIEHP
jgi:outer membrane protein assembly factor BamC